MADDDVDGESPSSSMPAPPMRDRQPNDEIAEAAALPRAPSPASFLSRPTTRQVRVTAACRLFFFLPPSPDALDPFENSLLPPKKNPETLSQSPVRAGAAAAPDGDFGAALLSLQGGDAPEGGEGAAEGDEGAAAAAAA